ncbi:D-inositol-3-phosphate glycosyltransferase [Flindersiella endophytica]
MRPDRARNSLTPRRVAMLSVHTSPLDQPGTGDAGGMNVYIVELARQLAGLGVQVEIFTRATSSTLPPVVDLSDGVRVRHVLAGPFEGLSKYDLQGQLCNIAGEVLRVEAAHEHGWYDVIHSHYWLSGQVGVLAKRRWGIPLVHTMHTMAKVKNAFLAKGDRPEPEARIRAEEEVVAWSDRLIANTGEEAGELITAYSADSTRVATVNPGVDLDVFSPGEQVEARRRLGVPREVDLLVFAGRIQPLKAPDVLIRALPHLMAARASGRRLVLAIVGGLSGSGLAEPHALATLARRLGVGDLVVWSPPVRQGELAQWYRAADAVVVPSYSESFGLVALEAQACGTPVVAAATGGLRTAVRDGVSGVLVDGHEPKHWGRVLGDLLAAPERLRAYGRAAIAHARGFGWAATARGTIDVYADAQAALGRPPIVA